MNHIIWKPVPGYEGFYEVSNNGCVRSISVYSYRYKRVIRRKHARRLKEEVTREGYKRVVLSFYGTSKHHSVHRLVAKAFIPNPDNLPAVNHKDENQGNNHVDNLEWCDGKYNSNYGTLPKRISKRQTNSSHLSRPVEQYTMQGEFISVFPSMREAERITGVRNECISRVCKGKSSHAGGFLWKYKQPPS